MKVMIMPSVSTFSPPLNGKTARISPIMDKGRAIGVRRGIAFLVKTEKMTIKTGLVNRTMVYMLDEMRSRAKLAVKLATEKMTPSTMNCQRTFG